MIDLLAVARDRRPDIALPGGNAGHTHALIGYAVAGIGRCPPDAVAQPSQDMYVVRSERGDHLVGDAPVPGTRERGSMRGHAKSSRAQPTPSWAMRAAGRASWPGAG